MGLKVHKAIVLQQLVVLDKALSSNRNRETEKETYREPLKKNPKLPVKTNKMMGIKSQGASQWHKGRLCPIRKTEAYFIKPSMELPEGYSVCKDVYMNPKNISQFLLPLKTGDELEFVLGERDKARPMARKVRVSQYSHRTYPVLKEYLQKFLEFLKSSDRNQALVETLPSTAMWCLLGSVHFPKKYERDAYIRDLLHLLTQLLSFGKSFKTLLVEMMKSVLQGTLFQSSRETGLPATVRCSDLLIDNENDETVFQTSISQIVPRFCQDVLKNVPQVARSLLPTILAVSETTPTAETQRFLYDLLSTTIGGTSCDPDTCMWHELPSMPTNQELAGGLVEHDKHLSPVKTNAPYENTEEYMDIYYRLLRAETFSAIQHGIKDLKACKLDPRDMNVYYNIHLAGYEVSNSRFSLAIHFKPAKKVQKWEASPQLMYGNLLCISPDRKFDDVIWATVSNRDPDLLKTSQIIMVELTDCNSKTTSHIIAALQAQNGTTVMVESPTYFHALRPVLSSLKLFDIESFPLKQEIVSPTPHQLELPYYLEDELTLDTSAVATGASNFGCEMDAKEFLRTFDHNSRTTLEASQCEALIHALKSRLAIIQGPPGCGKTFIGVKIVQLLLSLKPKLTKPILLLTYKNHALDEFLMQMLHFCRKEDLVRIGGRSKEPQLESCNLQSIMKNERSAKVQFDEIQETRNEINQIASQIKDMSGEVDSSCYFTRETLVDELSEEQMKSLLLEAGGDRAWIQSVLLNITKAFESLKTFLLMCIRSGVPKSDRNAVHCYKLFEKALKKWFPDKTELQRLKKFQAEFILEIRNAREEEKSDKGGSTKSDEDDADDGDFDEEHIKELLEARMAPIKQQGQERRKEDVVLFDLQKKKSQDILIKISDYPADMESRPHIRLIKNVWDLEEFERMQFLYCLLNEKASNVAKEFDELLEQFNTLKNRKQDLETQRKVSVLASKKIIGMTITGASIHHDIIHHIGPSVVIVEEAAEILEPSLLAALTPDIQHLILIGDHKQLRPQVATYELRKKYDFDVSMMERLINTKFPFKFLTKQNRMRPEFAALLHDIYPHLENNLDLVAANKPLECLEKSMFFWTHEDPEIKDRTFTNLKEAERVVSLVLYLLNNDCLPSEITVLSAYLGQTKLLRSMLKKEKGKRQELFQVANSGQPVDNSVQVQTIDMFQGDENKYIIVSLVRSNSENKIGFLNEMNRRCVAQSRAKCGMYFVGDANTLVQARNSCWKVPIHRMKDQNCVGNRIPLQCPKHKELSRCQAVDANTVIAIVDHPTYLCKEKCDDQFPCNILGHLCKKSCFPKHSHSKCLIQVRDRFSECNHPVTRKCHQKISHLRCQVEVNVVLQCEHKKLRECYMKTSYIRCNVMVDVILPQCGHQTKIECHKKIEDVSCKTPCQKTNTCEKHKCSQVCGKPHDHNNCQSMIDYKFPECGHPSSKKKKCSATINWKCSKKIYVKGTCGHEIEKLCHKKDSEVTCLFKPCAKVRKSCGHPCTNACGEDCEKRDCKLCEDIFQEKMKRFHATAEQRVKELKAKISKKVIPVFSRDPIHKSGATAAEYQKVEDQVMKFIQPSHNWYPSVTKIEKVTNLELEKKFEEAKSKAFGDHIDTKFHGTSNEGVDGITKNGFKMPPAKPPPGTTPAMYGQGIYFATDSSKSAQNIYTKGSGKLLLCQVILGKSKTVSKKDYTLTKEKLHSDECDSVFAPRNTEVKNDEFVIFNPSQALPQYIIHFSSGGLAPPLHGLLPPNKTFSKTNVVASRTVNFNDPFETYYHIAESHFMRMSKMGQPLSPQQATIASIDIVINKDLEAKFEATKKSFKSKGIPDGEILAYHGTDATKIDSILKDNLQLKYARGQACGTGNYFSEHPGVSIDYGDGLLLCRILPGKEFVDHGSGDIPPNYNSKKILSHQTASAMAGGTNVSGEMIIITNSDQILPYFVIHRQ